MPGYDSVRSDEDGHSWARMDSVFEAGCGLARLGVARRSWEKARLGVARCDRGVALGGEAQERLCGVRVTWRRVVWCLMWCHFSGKRLKSY